MIMRPDLVSVMMPVYNAEGYIAQAIGSVLSQTIPNWELVIVNDGSKDRSADIAAGFSDPRIKLIHQPNGGEASARNTALDNVQGEYLAFLDADDVFLPHHLEVAHGRLARSPDLDGVYTDGYHIDQHGTRMKSLTSRRRGPFEGWVFEQAVRASDVLGPPTSVVLRRRLILQHHLDFDTRIVIGPDWDFFTRFF